MTWYIPLIIAAVSYIAFFLFTSAKFRKLFEGPVNQLNLSIVRSVTALFLPILKFQNNFFDIKASGFIKFVLFCAASAITSFTRSSIPFIIFTVLFTSFAIIMMCSRIKQFRSFDERELVEAQVSEQKMNNYLLMRPLVKQILNIYLLLGSFQIFLNVLLTLVLVL